MKNKRDSQTSSGSTPLANTVRGDGVREHALIDSTGNSFVYVGAAEEVGPFLIHRAIKHAATSQYYEKQWALTHAATGLAIHDALVSLESARELAKALLSFDWDFKVRISRARNPLGRARATITPKGKQDALRKAQLICAAWPRVEPELE